MDKMRIIIMTMFVLTFLSFAGSAAAQSSDERWLGKYEHEELGGRELLQLEIKRSDGKLVAFYRSEATSTVFDKFSLTVEVKGNSAAFFFDQCLPLTAEESGEQEIDPCEGKTFQKGDLMFRFFKKTGSQNLFDVKAEKFDLHGDFVKVRKFMGE